MTISTDERVELIKESYDMIKILFGLIGGEGHPIGNYTQFGYHGLSIQIWTDHMDFLKRINGLLKDYPNILDVETIKKNELLSRWMLVNELIINFNKTSEISNKIIRENTMDIATILSYLLLEEVARIRSGKWDENGIVLEELPESYGIKRIKSKGKLEKNTYDEGQHIVDLAAKLYVMNKLLHPVLRENIERLDSILRKPFIEGKNTELSPLFNRLQFYRDNWLHGKKFSGWEGIFISFLLCSYILGSKENEY